MANFAAPPLQQVPLAAFLGLYTEASPTDLPEGVSPLTWDTDFFIGSVKMRPGVGSVYSFGGATTGPDLATLGTDVNHGNTAWTAPNNITIPGQHAAVTPVPLANGSIAAYPFLGANIPYTYSDGWSNPLAATGLPDGTFATVTVKSPTTPTSDYLALTNYQFGISTAMGVSGISLALTGLRSHTFGGPQVSVWLFYQGSVIGSPKTVTLTNVNSTVTVGNNIDTWGTTGLTPTIVNDPTFGIVIRATEGTTLSSVVSIDAAQLTVYTTVSISDPLYASHFGFAVDARAIQGIQVGITGLQTTVGGSVSVQLVKNGTPVGLAKQFSFTTVSSRIVLGGSGDTWLYSWAQADINSPQFGVYIIVGGASSSQTFQVSSVDITILQSSGTSNFNWVSTYQPQTGNLYTLAVDNNGDLWQEDVVNSPGTMSSISTAILPSCFCKGINLDQVEYMAFSDLTKGRDIPRQWNGASFSRISQVGPAAAPQVGYTTQGVAVSSITQAAAFNVPTTPHTYAHWNNGASPVGTVAGNVLIITFPFSFTMPAGFVNGAYVKITGMPNFGSVNLNNGAGTNPPAYQIFNVGTPVQGQSFYAGFSVLVNQTGSGANTIDGAQLQLTLATLTTAAPLPNVQVGSQFILSGETPGAWNGTWTALYTPNASQMNITNSVLSSGTATLSYTLVSGATPTVGQKVIVQQCVNGNGIFNGTFTITATGVGTFSYSIASPNVASSAESGQAVINGTIFQFEPQQVIGNDTIHGTVTTSGNIGAGARAAVVIFQTKTGYLTQTSPYIQFSAPAGANQLVVSNIPLGPPDVIKRIIAFTGAQVTLVPGQIGNFFYIPIPVTVFDPIAGQNVTYTSTVINDNTSTQATFTFTDAVLLASTAIDIQGNNLFAQKELGPCLGVISYANRLLAWGELNHVTNFINMSFDGGIGSINTEGGGTTGVTQFYPLGWKPSDSYGTVQNDSIFGTSYLITSPGGLTTIGMISQAAALDQYGVNILNPQIIYSVRIVARTPTSSTSGNLVVDLYSATFNSVYGSAVFPVNGLTSSFNLYSTTLLTNPFTSSVPNDLVLRVYWQGSVAIPAAAQIEIDRMDVYPTKQAVLETQLACSYINNFEAFDQITGVIDTATENQQPVRAAFTLYDTLYIVKTGSLISTQDNGLTEPFKWQIKMVSNVVGAFGPSGVDYVDNPNQGEAYALVAGRSGLYLFNGGEPVLLTGAIKSLWQKINWTYGQTVWVRNDPVNRRILVGVPLLPNQWLPSLTNTNPTTPNCILAMSYRELNHVTDLIENKEVRTSFTGKLIAPEMSRKWSIWQISANYGDFVQRSDNTAPLFLCNNTGNGKIYQLTEGRTDDDGVAINQLYTTAPLPSPDQAQGMMLGLGRYQYNMMKLNVTGSGTLNMTLLPDGMFPTTYPKVLPPITLPTTGGFDKDLSINVDGNRVFVQLSTNAPGDNFQWSDLVLYVAKHAFTPVRGV